mgnify:CR=1 FL=1
MKIRKIIVYLCVFAAAASIFTRIIYVNKVYPSVKIHNYNIGDTVNTDEYKICLDSVKVYEKAEWENYIDSTQIGRERDSYKADDKDAALKMRYNPDEDYKVIETELLVKNISGERKTDAELAMEKWIYNVLESSENKEDRKKFFDTSKYKSYLVSNNEKVKYIFENFLVDKWLREDRKLNNYVHANGIRFVMDNYVYQNKKEDKHKELIETLQNITDIFLSLLSVIDSIKFHSSDYLDALEMEMKPQEGSQYWVCPIIVEYMNDRFDKKLLQYIQNNEGNGMQFMAEYYNQNKG